MKNYHTACLHQTNVEYIMLVSARRISYEVRLFRDVKMNEFRVEIVWPGLVATLSLDLHASLNIQVH